MVNNQLPPCTSGMTECLQWWAFTPLKIHPLQVCLPPRWAYTLNITVRETIGDAICEVSQMISADNTLVFYGLLQFTAILLCFFPFFVALPVTLGADRKTYPCWCSRFEGSNHLPFFAINSDKFLQVSEVRDSMVRFTL